MRKLLFPLALVLFGVMFVLWIVLPETPSWWVAYVFGTVTAIALLLRGAVASVGPKEEK